MNEQKPYQSAFDNLSYETVQMVSVTVPEVSVLRERTSYEQVCEH